jgi:glycosyltransferase involved in cell wall biosynthesis
MDPVQTPTVSVVTPTLDRPDEVRELLENLARQRHLPLELVLVDAAPEWNEATAGVVAELRETLPYRVTYIRRGGGTAIQRNIGIEVAEGEFIAFIDDDIRLEPDFFELIFEEFAKDEGREVAAVVGCLANQFLDQTRSPRWRLYRRLRLFTTYEPGRYDYQSGYPINRYTQPPHEGVREIDFMGTNCAVWRRELFDEGLRLSPFFIDYGMLEDTHLALSARARGWRILEKGRARCLHLHSPRGRASRRRLARKTAVNYRFVFVDIVPARTLRQEYRFWRVQAVDLLRLTARAAVKWDREDWLAVLGKAEGMVAATRVRPGDTAPPREP